MTLGSVERGEDDAPLKHLLAADGGVLAREVDGDLRRGEGLVDHLHRRAVALVALKLFSLHERG